MLGRILAAKREDLRSRKSGPSLGELKKKAGDLPPTRNFAAAVAENASTALIAEIKRASPSAGVIRWETDFPATAREYERGGACAISILTESYFFMGKLDYLDLVRKSVSLPLLQKDFIIDAFQIYEGRIAGADAVLLIAAVLSRSELRDFVPLASSLGLFPLVEVHDEADLEKIAGLGLPLLGINNRNLSTLQVRLETTDRLIRKIAPAKKVISESGIRERNDVERLEKAGVKGILVGEILMRSTDPAAKIQELLGRR